jgi:PIN domain nuclease of toxin-antitoxin system
VTDRQIVVMDASAVLTLINEEPGVDVLEPVLGGMAISAVNLSEVAGKLIDRGMPVHEVCEVVDGLHLVTHDFGSEAAIEAAALRRQVPLNLSLGDRACLALARRLGLPAVTADKEWADVTVSDLDVRIIR